MTSRTRRTFKYSAGSLLLAAALAVSRPAVFLGWVWWHDPAAPLSAAAAGSNDASGLSPNQPGEVIPVAESPAEAEQQLVALVARARATGLRISISGASHSMGGHTMYPGALVLNMLPFHGLNIDPEGRVLHAGAGARWADVLPYLDARG